MSEVNLTEARIESHTQGLRRNALPFSETLAQSVANIAPTATPALAIPLVAASSGNGTWLTFLLATIGLLLVSVCINQFARRSATPGSLYSYASEGLGTTAGFLVGWSLILAYIATAVVVVIGFALFTSELLALVGIAVPPYVLFVIDVLLFWYLAYRDIQLSAMVMLIIEAVSVGAILLLGVVVLFGAGVFDGAQLSLSGVTFEGIRLGMILAILGFVGFESATALGAEAREPLRNIPRAVLWSTGLVGTFFVLMAYTEVAGFNAVGAVTAESQAPLNDLANLYNVPFFGVLISLGAALSFFACGLACVNAVSRIMLAKSRDGVLHQAMGRAHLTNETPHIAVTFAAILTLVLVSGSTLLGFGLLDTYTYFGTMATFGFLLPYIVMAIASVVYLRRLGVLGVGHIFVAVGAVLVMLLPIVGSLYPVPPYPLNILPYLYLAYIVIGAVWVYRATRARVAVAPST